MKHHCCKPHVSNVLPAVVHPTKQCVNQTFTNNIVPHIHPTHTTTVNHVNYQHQHFFPQTNSTETVVTNQNFVAAPTAAAPATFGGGGFPAAGGFGGAAAPGAFGGFGGGAAPGGFGGGVAPGSMGGGMPFGRKPFGR
ncbi:spore coat protein CotD [Robertmurraya yapensis]|uniref:Spore coat protein CotD n=1 Tax=Bacillus yapensis TaxID=2492960 RepID=A0A3S0IE19_9BACI|nr:CotD family spore coat protein [Bacillus yapensis]RTR30479.1 spore coat protein CotD [Bacillus yapensis]TKS95298.1 spore coat protein CotD [Bacillus yapensis]